MIDAGDLHGVVDVLDDLAPTSPSAARRFIIASRLIRAVSSVEQASSPPHFFDIAASCVTTSPLCFSLATRYSSLRKLDS